MIYYQVRDKIFFNVFESFVYGAYYAPHDMPKFYVFDNEFEKHDWTKEPQESWESLLAKRAHQLREKYDVLILGFSGGTDSITMYNAFAKNNIFIDEISFVWEENNPAGTEYIGKWLKSNHLDSRTKITNADMKHRQFEELYQRSTWIIEDLDNMMVKFDRRWPGREELREAEDRYPGKKWAFVLGKEKPQVYKKNGQWFVTHLDKLVHWSTTRPMHDRTEFFFISKDAIDLHAKQCHMLKSYANFRYRPKDYWASWDNLGKKSMPDYDEFASLGCGRHQEILPGSSFSQKIRANQRTITDATHLLDGKIDKLVGLDPKFLAKYQSGHTWTKNYIQGLQSLQTDPVLLDYLLRHGLLNSSIQPVISYNGMFGQSYALE